jgi:hypothetical protein
VACKIQQLKFYFFIFLRFTGEKRKKSAFFY